MEVVLVRKSGPVATMSFKAWWIYFLFLVLALMLVGLGAGTYLFLRQHQALSELAQDTHLLILRTERLESLVQEQTDRDLMVAQTSPPAAQAQPKPAPNTAQQPKTPPNAKQNNNSATKQAVSPKPTTSKEASPTTKPEESKPNPKPDGQEKAAENDAAQPVKQPKQASEPEEDELSEPTISEDVLIKDVKMKSGAAKLSINFKVANKKAPEGKAMGYTTVVLRGARDGKAWVEAWPPMKLTPLGRPVNYRRGMPFSVQYHRPLKAVFSKDDKDFERLEFLVYSREGKLELVHIIPLQDNGDTEGDSSNSGGKT